MKKIATLLCAILLVFVFAVPAFAAGVDDGTLLVVTKEGQKYFGTEIAEDAVKYVAANGADGCFYDLNADVDMNVCDMVAATKNKTDLNGDGAFDGADLLLIRKPIVDGKF